MLLYFFCLIHEIFLSDRWSVTLRHLTFRLAAHHVIPWLSPHWLTLDGVSAYVSRGYVLMSPDPKVRKTITYRGAGVKKVQRLLVYSVFVFIPVFQREDGVFLSGFAVSLAPSLHGRGDKWWVTQRAGGQTPCPNYLSVFSLFSVSFSLSLSHFFLLSVFFSTPVNLSLFSSRVPPLPPSLPSIHLSLSLMNISHRNAIYSLFLRSIHQAQISHLWVLSDWGWVSCHFQLSSVLRIMPFLFQSVMRDGWFTLICFYHRSTLINVYVTEKKWFHFGVVSLCDSTMKFLIACFSSVLAHFKLKVRDGSKILSHKIYLFLNSLFSGIPYE